MPAILDFTSRSAAVVDGCVVVEAVASRDLSVATVGDALVYDWRVSAEALADVVCIQAEEE